jgi:uncharacterized protein
VKGLDRSRSFDAEILGWTPSTASNDGAAFFKAGGVVLSHFSRKALAEDASIGPEGSGFGGMTLACNTRSGHEVDEVIHDLSSKGVTILKQAQKAFWGGYHACFADPDGIPWEVASNPFFLFENAGNLNLE